MFWRLLKEELGYNDEEIFRLLLKVDDIAEELEIAQLEIALQPYSMENNAYNDND